MNSLKRILRLLSSLKLAIVCLAVVMVLVVVGTLAQVNAGIFSVQQTYFRSFFLYWCPEGTSWKIPIFPGGLLVGAVLVINLLTAHFQRFKLSISHLGVLLIHLGLLFLIVGEFFTAFFSVESQLIFKEGEAVNYSESRYIVELAIVDTSPSEYDQVLVFSQAQCEKNKVFRHKDLPFKIHLRRWYPNAHLFRQNPEEPKPPLSATQGIGLDVLIEEEPPVVKDNQVNLASAFVELRAEDTSLGTWLLSSAIPTKQVVTFQGKAYELSIRRARYYLPFSMKLEKFTHEVHPGTEVPSYFSSLVSLYDESGDFERQTLIYMNQPLRLDGKSFYQASYGEADTVSVLQVVQNPTRLFPYIACAAVTGGLIFQFVMKMTKKKKRA